MTIHRSRTELDAVEFIPFRAAIARGVRAIMTGHLVAPALDDQVATVSRTVTTDVLRTELGFGGAIVTDALEMTAMAGSAGPADGFVQALVAGADLVEAGAQEYPELVDDVPHAVETALGEGFLTERRLREASARAGAVGVPGQPAEYDRTRVEGSARHAIEVHGRLPELRRPLVVECRPPAGMASGEILWSLGDALATRLEGTETVRVSGGATDVAIEDIAAQAIDRSLVVVVRDPVRHDWQRPWIALARARPCAVVVDAGWPDETLAGVAFIRTRGVAPALMLACADVLTDAGRC